MSPRAEKGRRVSARPTFRFAPSPNGRLHLGHAYSALLNHELARGSGGRFLLRIEDIDAARSREDLVEAVYEDLRWLGLDWEDVPRQSTRLDGLRRRAAQARRDRPAVRVDRVAQGAWPRPSPRSRSRRAVLGRATPMALRCTLRCGLAKRARGGDISRRRGRPAADMERAPGRRRPTSPGSRTAPDRRVRRGSSLLAHRSGATSSSGGRRFLRAITSPSSWTTRSRASRTSCAGRTSSMRPRSTGCCSIFSGCRRPATTITVSSAAATARSSAKSLASRSLASLRDEGLSPADVRRLVGL